MPHKVLPVIKIIVFTCKNVFQSINSWINFKEIMSKFVMNTVWADGLLRVSIRTYVGTFNQVHVP